MNKLYKIIEKEFGRSKVRWQKRQTVGSDLLRRFKKLKEYFLEFIGILHAFVSNEGDDWRKEKERHESILWCGMNRSYSEFFHRLCFFDSSLTSLLY